MTAGAAAEDIIDIDVINDTVDFFARKNPFDGTYAGENSTQDAERAKDLFKTPLVSVITGTVHRIDASALNVVDNGTDDVNS